MTCCKLVPICHSAIQKERTSHVHLGCLYKLLLGSVHVSVRRETHYYCPHSLDRTSTSLLVRNFPSLLSLEWLIFLSTLEGVKLPSPAWTKSRLSIHLNMQFCLKRSVFIFKKSARDKIHNVLLLHILIHCVPMDVLGRRFH